VVIACWRLLQVLRLGSSFNRRLDDLPAGLQELCIGGGEAYASFSQPLGALPPGLRVLDLGGTCGNEPLGELPATLEGLVTSNFYNIPLGALPPGLHTLCLGWGFIHPLGVLPPALSVLQINRPGYAHALGPLPTLEHLYVYEDYDQPLEGAPPGLTVTKMDHNW
jgi:hypothetical protein